MSRQVTVVSLVDAIADWLRPRIGDVVVAAVADIAIVAMTAEPREARLIGHHGSATAAEQLVPLAMFDAFAA